MNKLSEGPLLDGRGVLSEAGYQTYLAKTYDRNSIAASRLRVKEWDYYLIYTPSFALALTIADNGYMGLLSASVIDLDKPSQITKSVMSIFTLGKWRLPATSERGDVRVRRNDRDFSFENDGVTRRLRGSMQNFSQDGRHLSFDIRLTDAPADSMVIATPFTGKPKAFYYNQKIVGMRAEGVCEYGEKRAEFSGDALAILDWGRGVWPYEGEWYWSAATRAVGGRVIGFNLGYGFGDTSAATENMLFADGRASKIEHVTFEIPKTADGTDDFMRKWRFTSSDGRFEADFTPIIDRAARTQVGPLLSDQHQVFGRFDGSMILDGGERIELRDFTGFAEKVHNKW